MEAQVIVDCIAIIVSAATSIVAIIVSLLFGKRQNQIAQRQTELVQRQTELVQRQTELVQRQTELAQVQTKFMQQQNKIAVFDKRYAIYCEMEQVLVEEFNRLYKEPVSHGSITNWLLNYRRKIKLLFNEKILKEYDEMYRRYTKLCAEVVEDETLQGKDYENKVLDIGMLEFLLMLSKEIAMDRCDYEI